MSRRLNEANKSSGSNEKSVDFSVLLQSLTGAMGEIGEIFGSEAATEVMANIITGTARGVTEESLMSSIQNSLAGLSRLDPNKTKIAKLSESFNKDLSLMLDPELADKKLESKQTFSLSYALARHFGALNAPAANTGAQEETEQAGATDSGDESHEMPGFDATGKWDTVAVTKPDESAAEEIRAAAELGLNKATELTLATIMKQENGSRIFANLSGFLEKNFQDEAAFRFVDECIMNSTVGPESASPKVTEMISQVYSKIAADGDADKLHIFENYINTDFKEAINPVLAAMQQGDETLLPGAEELGALQFKGISGASMAGESDAFSLNFGYEKDNTYDRSISKRFLQEDIRAVKAAKENAEQAEQDRFAKNWDDTDEEKRIKEAKNRPNAHGAAANSGKTPSAEADADDLDTTFEEKFAAERRQRKLEEAMTTKFGQLSDSSREELEQYLKDNFSEEESEKFLEHTKWNSDLMSGLAAVHRDIRESGADESKAKGFMNFLNGTLKKEVEGIAGELGGLAFEGWQALDGGVGELEAGFKFNGHDSAKVIIMGLEQTLNQENGEQLDTDQHFNASQIPRKKKETEDAQETLISSSKLLNLGTGYLIDLMA